MQISIENNYKNYKSHQLLNYEAPRKNYEHEYELCFVIVFGESSIVNKTAVNSQDGKSSSSKYWIQKLSWFFQKHLQKSIFDFFFYGIIDLLELIK